MNAIIPSKTISFTGHRNILFSDDIKLRLLSTLQTQILCGFDTFLLGMAKGFDLYCGNLLLSLKEKYPNIKIIAVIPCDNQTDGFSEIEKIYYKKILHSSFDIIQTGKSKTASSMKKRNRFLVDNSSMLIAYLLRHATGTFYTCNYAYKKPIKVINIAEIL